MGVAQGHAGSGRARMETKSAKASSCHDAGDSKTRSVIPPQALTSPALVWQEDVTERAFNRESADMWPASL